MKKSQKIRKILRLAREKGTIANDGVEKTFARQGSAPQNPD